MTQTTELPYLAHGPIGQSFANQSQDFGYLYDRGQSVAWVKSRWSVGDKWDLLLKAAIGDYCTELYLKYPKDTPRLSLLLDSRFRQGVLAEAKPHVSKWKFSEQLNNGVLEIWNGAAWTSAPAPGFTLNPGRNSIAAVGEGYIAGTDTARGIHASGDAGQTWYTIEGMAAGITGGAVYTFVLSTAGVPEHVNLVVPQLTATGGGGPYNCPANGCPAGSEHTVTATAYFG
jgi:hypothetical protein